MRIIGVCTVVALVLAMGGVAEASSLYSTPQSHLLDAVNYTDADMPVNTGTLYGRSAWANPGGMSGATYNVSLDAASGWSDIQIGDGFDHPANNSGLATGFLNMGSDFSGFSQYSLLINNPNATLWFMANITMNTGWTDAPDNEADLFTENGWVWVAPGATQVLSIDLTGVANLDHVSNIGIKIGANVTGDEGWNPAMGQGVAFDVNVAPIPEPLTMLGVLAGVSGLAGYIRRRRLA